MTESFVPSESWIKAPGESCQNSMLHVLFLAVGDVAGNRNHHVASCPEPPKPLN